MSQGKLWLPCSKHRPNRGLLQRLKGPFPKDFYKEMIVSTRNLLDRLMSIRIALTNMPLEVKNDICKRELNVYRRDMVSYYQHDGLISNS